ncbi:MAG: exopolysaccharide biosynthesis protein [Deltaproteobacteria bacterium]|nr:exopolysaccharide biosynthesis protein [Deltaproteobacteria bacterium]
MAHGPAPERLPELPASALDRAKNLRPAPTPHRLRLGELLRDLGASDGTPAPTLAEGSTSDARPESLTVGQLVDKASEAGFGFLIGILTLIAIPFFGLSTPFGLAIALIGAQMVVGRDRPWLPARARRRPLKMSMLDRVSRLLARRRWLAKMTRRRWEPMIRTRLIGLGVLILALGLALPLPIPGSNLIFLIPLFVYAIGLLERDGVWVAIGHACVLINVTLLVLFSATVILVLEKIWSWVT